MRDQLLMTPLVDLRQKPSAPAGHQDELRFFSDKERIDYPERFKQEFVRMRKDIRVFGAGGAFEHMAKLPNLTELAAQVLAKKPLSDADIAAIRAGSQDIRFVFFLALTAESLRHEFRYEFRSDQELDRKIYVSERNMTVRLALWDSKVNRTVWIGTERLAPNDTNIIEVQNPTKARKKQKDGRIIWVGEPERTNLERELARNPGNFPSFPGREPSFSQSFDDFALGLPMHPSEAKLIEYTHFSYHRPELMLRTSKLGSETSTNLQFGLSSAINYYLRFGGVFMFPLSMPTVTYEGQDLEVGTTAFGATFDYEWVLKDNLRLLTGAIIGQTVFELAPPEGELNVENKSDSALFGGPRIFCLFGAKGGLQGGLGVSARFYDGIEEPALKANRPSLLSFDLSIAYATRGF